MGRLIKYDHRNGVFGRTIDEVLQDGFFSSLDSNIREMETGYDLEVAVPGMSKNDLQINLSNNTLSIHGQKQSQRNTWWKAESQEFSTIEVRRSYVLPQDAHVENIEAKCKNGLLRISVPKLSDNVIRQVIQIEDTKQVDNKYESSLRKLTNLFGMIKKRIRQLFKQGG